MTWDGMSLLHSSIRFTSQDLFEAVLSKIVGSTGRGVSIAVELKGRRQTYPRMLRQKGPNAEVGRGMTIWRKDFW